MTILLWDYPLIIETFVLRADANGDGVVDISDLVLVAQNFGKVGQNAADVNGDGIVDIADLLIVAGALNDGAAATTLYSSKLRGHFTSSDVQSWLMQASQLDISDVSMKNGINYLEHLLLILTPIESALLPNYPNPFNPETWIPYQLSETSDVKIEIYSDYGKVIRILDIGEKDAGLYQSKRLAAYWDGKNEIGEPVASGVYYYKLSTGNFNTTRKMVIRK